MYYNYFLSTTNIVDIFDFSNDLRGLNDFSGSNTLVISYHIFLFARG